MRCSTFASGVRKLAAKKTTRSVNAILPALTAVIVQAGVLRFITDASSRARVLQGKMRDELKSGGSSNVRTLFRISGQFDAS
jgi:hypothetical protein